MEIYINKGIQRILSIKYTGLTDEKIPKPGMGWEFGRIPHY